MDSWSNIYEKASVGRPQSNLTSPACVNYISRLQTTAICYQPSGHQYFLYYAPHPFWGKAGRLMIGHVSGTVHSCSERCI